MSNISGFVKRIRDIMRNDPGINGDAQRIEQIAWMLFLKVYDAKEQDWDIDEDNYESIIPENCRWANWAVDDHSGSAMTGDRLLSFVNNTLFPTLKELNVTPETPIKKSIVRTTFEDTNNYMKDGVLLRQVINVIDELDLGDYEESHAFGEIYESILKELQSAGSAGEFYTPRAVTDFMAQMIQPKIGEKMADFACGTGGFITSWLKELEKKVRTTEDQAAYGDSIYGIEKKQFPYMLCITNLLLHGVDLPRVYHDNSLIRDVLDYTEDDQFDVILMNPPYGGSEKTEVKNHFPADLASSETADLFMAVIMYRLKKNGRCAVILPDGFLFGTDNAKVNLKKKLLSEFNLHTIVRMPGSVFAPYTSITTNILFFDNTGKTEETWFYRLDMPEGYKHFSKTKPMKVEHFAPVVEWWNDRRVIEDQKDSDEATTTYKSQKYTYKQLTEEIGYDLDQCGYPHEEEEILSPSDLFMRYQEERASLNTVVDRALTYINSSLFGGSEILELGPIDGALGRLAEIDKSFPSEMQKSLLQMAIQGKLVEQRPEEGTGEALFAQVQIGKQVLIQKGLFKKDKVLPEIVDDEKPFDIPESWKWVRLDDLVCKSIRRGKSPTYTAQSGTLVFAQKCNTKKGFIDLSLALYLDESKLSKYPEEEFMRDKDIVINSTGGGTMGRVGFYHDSDNPSSIPVVPDSHVTIVRVSDSICAEYIHFVIKNYQPYMERQGSGSTNQTELNAMVIRALLIPLPPLAEQKRIVAKLEELLPLCERLK